MNSQRTIDENLLRQLTQSQPIVLLGMHRSGTSLLARLMVDLGIYMGAWLSRDAESVFFQRLNRLIYKAAGARWDEVETLLEAITSDAFVSEQVAAMQMELLRNRHFPHPTLGIRRFFGAGAGGADRWVALCKGSTLPWGWKDPRTTLTLPIWGQVFPQVRWIHMIRNGVDVAISTHRRSAKQQHKLRNRLPALRMDYNPATLDFDYCFRLWEIYVSFATQHLSQMREDSQLNMRYESLLTNPERELRRLLSFLDMPVAPDRLAAACSRVNAGRLDNAAHALPYRDRIPALIDSPVMQRLNYTYAIPALTRAEAGR